MTELSLQLATTLLQPSSAVLNTHYRPQARRLLEAAVQANPRSERGWLWLADAVDEEEERRFCLTKVLAINRRNALARRRLEALGAGTTRSPLLPSARVALDAGHTAQARRILEAEVQANPRSERGWLWLADAVDKEEERRFCLTQVLTSTAATPWLGGGWKRWASAVPDHRSKDGQVWPNRSRSDPQQPSRDTCRPFVRPCAPIRF